jgi:hypothetical protein
MPDDISVGPKPQLEVQELTFGPVQSNTAVPLFSVNYLFVSGAVAGHVKAMHSALEKDLPGNGFCLTEANLERNYGQECNTSCDQHCHLDGSIRLRLRSVIG